MRWHGVSRGQERIVPLSKSEAPPVKQYRCLRNTKNLATLTPSPAKTLSQASVAERRLRSRLTGEPRDALNYPVHERRR